jgi:valyl-tRNA synthetase
MIMAGYEWMGEMPFKNVYFTGIIRDKQGRKMSKSLGNSPDPLDLIKSYSADALRFGIMRSAPLGQDICFDEKNVELGRNFCTKLWNAARFRQMQSSPPAPGGSTFDRDNVLATAFESEINPALLSSDDKWILLPRWKTIVSATQPPSSTASSGTSIATGTWRPARPPCRAPMRSERRTPSP